VKANMENPDEELIYCKACNAHLLIQWEHDDDADNFLTPSYCPLCGSPIRGDEFDQDNYNEDYE
jgi:hypothetical protein